MEKRIGIGILGGTGFGAGELLRLLTEHPDAQVVSVTSGSQVGSPLHTAHPQLLGFYDQLQFEKEMNYEAFEKFEHKFVFAALPHGASAQTISLFAEELRERSIKLIDLSGDFRLKNKTNQQTFYPDTSAPESLRAEFVYGLPEINREAIARAKFVSNPGCLATAAALAFLPLAKNYSGALVCDAKTGTSGAGKTPQESMHHPTRHASMTAYKILEHRHEPEIAETLGDANGSRLQLTFVPHLVPLSRGILCTAYGTLASSLKTEELRDAYREFYLQSPFVRIREASPELYSVIGSNFCDITVFARKRQVVAIAALDNLVKGMGGVAIQNMNLMAGIPETTGIWKPGLGPN